VSELVGVDCQKYRYRGGLAIGIARKQMASGLEAATSFVYLIGDIMLDNDKIDEVVLALLLLGLHDGSRAWKGFDWGAMNRLYEKGFISDPHGKTKSVVLTEIGLNEAQYLLEKLFSEQPQSLAQDAKETVYAIVRFDHFVTITADSFTVKEIVRNRAIAESEVERLNRVNGDKHCSYFLQATRLFPAGRSAGDARGEKA
jgi:uncharacterized protein DUF6429